MGDRFHAIANNTCGIPIRFKLIVQVQTERRSECKENGSCNLPREERGHQTVKLALVGGLGLQKPLINQSKPRIIFKR